MAKDICAKAVPDENEYRCKQFFSVSPDACLFSKPEPLFDITGLTKDLNALKINNEKNSCSPVNLRTGCRIGYLLEQKDQWIEYNNERGVVGLNSKAPAGKQTDSGGAKFLRPNVETESCILDQCFKDAEFVISKVEEGSNAAEESSLCFPLKAKHRGGRPPNFNGNIGGCAGQQRPILPKPPRQTPASPNQVIPSPVHIIPSQTPPYEGVLPDLNSMCASPGNAGDQCVVCQPSPFQAQTEANSFVLQLPSLTAESATGGPPHCGYPQAGSPDMYPYTCAPQPHLQPGLDFHVSSSVVPPAHPHQQATNYQAHPALAAALAASPQQQALPPSAPVITRILTVVNPVQLSSVPSLQGVINNNGMSVITTEPSLTKISTKPDVQHMRKNHGRRPKAAKNWDRKGYVESRDVLTKLDIHFDDRFLVLNSKELVLSPKVVKQLSIQKTLAHKYIYMSIETAAKDRSTSHIENLAAICAHLHLSVSGDKTQLRNIIDVKFDDTKQTALYMTVRYQLPDHFKLLLHYGAKIDVMCEMNSHFPEHVSEPVLHCIVRQRNVDFLRILVECRKDSSFRVDCVDSHGFTALHCICKWFGRPHREDIEKSPIDQSSSAADLKLVRLLLDAGASVCRQNVISAIKHGTALHYASASISSAPLLRLLIDHLKASETAESIGKIINIQDNNGDSCFHKVVTWEVGPAKEEIVALLIKVGVDKHLENNSGVSPMDICKRRDPDLSGFIFVQEFSVEVPVCDDTTTTTTSTLPSNETNDTFSLESFDFFSPDNANSDVF